MTGGRDGAPRPHRPARFADLTEMIDAAGGASTRSNAEIANDTAQALLRAGRASEDALRFVELADVIGLDTLAALWRDSEPTSLPGALWALYLLRQWCRNSTEEVTRFWRAGEPLAPAEAAVAGVPDFPDSEAVQVFADAVLVGVYTGEFDVALERAAGFFRVVAAGRRSLGASEPPLLSEVSDRFVDLAVRNDRVAQALSMSAKRWRDGSLQ